MIGRGDFTRIDHAPCYGICLAGACLWGVLLTFAQPAPPLPIALVVTNSLVHFWPNLWDAHDQVTGQDGYVMGILPNVPSDKPDTTPFNDASGWVQLPARVPADSAFTVTVWFQAGRPTRSQGVALGLHFGDQRWWLRDQSNESPNRYGVEVRGIHPDNSPQLLIPPETWLHLAITRSDTGRLTLWMDSVPEVAGTQPFHPDNDLSWITAGNDTKGDVQWSGLLRDLAVFQRVLTQDELRALHAPGPPAVRPCDSHARRTARSRPEDFTWSTNVVRRSINELTHRRYTAEDGMPANNVQCLLQTRDGYLWLGSDTGIARFDGRSFRTFTADNSPALRDIGSDILSLAEDDDGTLWAGVYGGLLRIRGTEVVGFPNGLPERFLLLTAPADHGALWIAGFRLDRHDRGPCRVRRFHPDTGQSTAEVVVPGHVRRLVPTSDGLWLTTEDPELLLYWDMVSPAPVVVAKLSGPPFNLRIRDDANLPAPVRVRGWQDPLEPSRRWLEFAIGHDGLAFHWLAPKRRATASASRWIAAHNPQPWLGGQAGLARIQSDQLEQITFGEIPSSLQVAALGVNREGGVWLGTDVDGLHLVQERLVRVWTTRDGLSGNDIRSVIATREGSLLVGGPSGLDEFKDGPWIRLGVDGPVPLSSVVSLAQDPFGTVWIGLDHYGNDAMRLLRHNTALTPPLSGISWMHPRSTAMTPHGRLWIACNLGLTWIEPNEPMSSPATGFGSRFGSLRHGRIRVGDPLPDVPFLKLLPDHGDSLWVGTAGNGLLRVTSDRVETLTIQHGLPSDNCVPAHVDDTGALWLVARDAVVRRANGRTQTIRPEDGIPNDYFLDLIEDDSGHFWLPGSRGIHRLIRRELESFFAGQISQVQSLTLGVRDGLLTPGCTSLHYPITAKTPDGRIWVATRNGVASLDPDRMRLDSQPLTASIEQIICGRHRVVNSADATSTLLTRLAPGSGQRVEFHYSAISLVAADRVRFRYRLDGYDSAWSPETDQRQAVYTNLRPGKYQFHVKAANEHGIWNDQTASFKFVITPHLWEARSLRATLVIIVLAIAALLHRHRLSVLQHLEELKHLKALTTEKERIASDVHDDLGAALTQIAILSEVAKNQPAPQPQAQSMLDQISQSARDATARMSDLVWATNPRNDTLDNLTAYLREQAARQLEHAPIQTTLRFPERLPECRVSALFRRNVLLAVKETINNALKHGAPASLLIELTILSGQLCLRVEDDGRGFDPATRTLRGNGLLNLRRRIEELGGSIHIASAAGAGTRVHFQIPLPILAPPFTQVRSSAS
jgi:signal transduction histidine kinase/ligand-binding sensor domain-containing protein